jgi:hypothetical protein
MSSNVLPRIALLAVCFGLGACADFSRGAESPIVDAAVESAGEASDGAAASFAATVEPILIVSCERCHSAGGMAGDTQLLLTGAAAADYATVSRFVNAAAPAGSRLLAKAGGTGHGGGTVLAAGSPEFVTVLQWIQQGARP